MQLKNIIVLKFIIIALLSNTIEVKSQDTISKDKSASIQNTPISLNQKSSAENEPKYIHIIDDSPFSTKDWINVILAALALITTFAAVRGIFLSKEALQANKDALNANQQALQLSKEALQANEQALLDNIKNRNLSFIGEFDKMLIENPVLWEFYDANKKLYRNTKTSNQFCEKELQGKLEALAYYTLNHLEIILLDNNENLKAHWRDYVIYCLKKSTVFKKKVEKITNKSLGERELYRDAFILEIEKIYKDVFKET